MSPISSKDEFSALLGFTLGWKGFRGTHEKAARLIEGLATSSGGLSQEEVMEILEIGRSAAHEWLKREGGKIPKLVAAFAATRGDATVELVEITEVRRWKLEFDDGSDAGWYDEYDYDGGSDSGTFFSDYGGSVSWW